MADICLKALHDPVARNKTFEVRTLPHALGFRVCKPKDPGTISLRLSCVLIMRQPMLCLLYSWADGESPTCALA